MGTKMTVVAFIIMPAATHSYTIEALKGQAVTKQLRDTVTEIQNRIGARLFERTARYSGCVFNLCTLLKCPADLFTPTVSLEPRSPTPRPCSRRRTRSCSSVASSPFVATRSLPSPPTTWPTTLPTPS